MSFIRPSVAAHFIKWREAYLVGFVLILGLWLFLRGSATLNLILQGLGLVVAMIGIILLRTTIQRIRFKRAEMAPGIVTITEREINYFGPLTGKTISLDLSLIHI